MQHGAVLWTQTTKLIPNFSVLIYMAQLIIFHITVGFQYNAPLYYADFDITLSGLGSTTGAYSIIAQLNYYRKHNI